MLEGPIRVGDRLLWEPDLPHAFAFVRVTAVRRAGGNGWVQTEREDPPGARHWNEESRVREACVRVCEGRGSPVPGGAGPMADHLQDIARRLAEEMMGLDEQARRLQARARRETWAEALALVRQAAEDARRAGPADRPEVGWLACCAYLAGQIRGKVAEGG